MDILGLFDALAGIFSATRVGAEVDNDDSKNDDRHKQHHTQKEDDRYDEQWKAEEIKRREKLLKEARQKSKSKEKENDYGKSL